MHPKLAEEVAQEMGITLGEVELDNFANGEIRCRISQSVRGSDVFIIQSHCGNVNDAVIEQAIMIDTAKRASARSITAVCPFLAYARQDRKSTGREPITARLVVDILANAGADRIMSVDLHSGQIQGFFDGPFDHLIARPILADYLQKNFKTEDLVVVSPDAGRVKSAERYGSDLSCAMAIVHKQRSAGKHSSVDARYLIGDVKGKACFVVDDMIDTAGTVVAAAELLAENGAAEIYALATHGVLSNPALERLEASPISRIIVTNTLPQRITQNKNMVTVLSIAPLIANAISAVYAGDSVSAIFGGHNQT